jgi:hypothetical protein
MTKLRHPELDSGSQSATRQKRFRVKHGMTECVKHGMTECVKHGMTECVKHGMTECVKHGMTKLRHPELDSGSQ